MAESEIDRKIAVIFVADVVGYSKHMEKDENATFKAYGECEKILNKLLKKYKGSVFNTAGDSVLAEFPSAVNAVECAVDFQNEIKDRNASDKTDTKLEFRIGINMGDVVQKEGNLLGDGVNIAARLEALAQPNGITISKSVYDLVVPKTKVTFNDLGVQKVKQNTFHAYDILLDPSQKRKLKTQSTSNTTIFAGIAAALIIAIAGFFMINRGEEAREIKAVTSGKPSILITNFTNMTGDINNNFLGDGITNNIIATLNKSERFEVPPSSTAQYIQKNELPNTEVREKYGIEFIVTGNIQGNADKLRVTAEMMDVAKNKVIWSEVYDFKKADDIFEIQDAVSLSILKASRVKMVFAPAEPVSKNAEVYKMHLKAGALFNQNTPESNKAAQKLFEDALEIEPTNHQILNNLAWIFWQKIYMGISKNPKDDIKNGLKYAEASLLHSPNFPGALSATASLEMMAGNYERSCEINRTIGDFIDTIADRALNAAGQHFCGDLENAIANYEYVLKKAPHISSILLPWQAWLRYACEESAKLPCWKALISCEQPSFQGG